MRVDWPEPRGEARRVAERVRELLREHENPLSELRAEPPPADSVRRGWSLDGRWRAPGADGDVGHGARGLPGADAEQVPAVVGDARRVPVRSRSASPFEGDDPLRPTAWRRLVARIPVRLDPGRRAAMGVGVAVLLAAVLTGIWLVSQRPRSAPVSDPAPTIAGSRPLASSGVAPAPPGGYSAGSSGAASTGGPSPGAVEVVIDVAGRVHRPGLYRLRAGSRIDDALTAAGGPLPGVKLDSLNLAAKVVDGQQIVVGLQGASAAGQPVGAAGSPAGSGAGAAAGPGGGGAPVSLNSATLEQLETLPGVGPVLGQHILDWRSAHGSFTSIDQLNDVTGIGDVKFAALKSLVTL